MTTPQTDFAKLCARLECSSSRVPSRHSLITSSLFLGTALALQPNLAAATLAPAEALKKLSIEELLDVEVTSVSRQAERLGSAAAAIAVVSNEDIRRSGATSIPETLRGVPGIFVGQRNANSWSVSSRGFSSLNSEKLLVLTDTRSIYTPLYSGVFWDVQDYLLQDIERIEVIRGPGAALWGSNAVNGVVNIITKHSRDTQGLYAEAGGGSEAEAIASARYGGTIGDTGSFRVFAKYAERDATYHPGAQSNDDWHIGQVGARGDWEFDDGNSLMLDAAAYEGEVGLVSPSIEILGRPGPTGPLTTDVDGGHVLAHWRRQIDEQSHWRTRVYYDRTRRDDPSFLDELDTVDLDFQHGFKLAARHEILWGVNYRHTENRNVGKGVFAVLPNTSKDEVISGFVQDQIQLTRDIRLTVGTKLEDNEFSGFELQPSIRAAWDVSAESTVWGAVSRAARVPTRLERDIAIDVTAPGANPSVQLLGHEDLDSEELIAYEIGWRWHPLEGLSIDLSAFHNEYEGLMSLEQGDPFIDPSDGRLIVPIINRNLTDGRSNGFEALLTYAPLPIWRVIGTYSFVDLSLDPGGADINRGEWYEGATPRHQVSLRSLLDLPGGLQFDAHLRHVTDIERSPEIVSGEGIDGYTELDVRLAWQAWNQLEVSIVGQNLLHDRHVEVGAPQSRGAIERSVYAKLAWGF